MLHILCCVPVSSADDGQSDTCPHLLCSSLSAFPGTSGLISRLLNNPRFNLCQLKKCVINIYLFREHFWARLMKRHPFDLVALLLLQSSTLFHKSCWFASIRELGTGFACYDLGKKDIETLFFMSSVIQLSLPFSTRHAFSLSICLLKRILTEPLLFTLGVLHLPWLDFGLLKWPKLCANTLLL